MFARSYRCVLIFASNIAAARHNKKPGIAAGLRPRPWGLDVGSLPGSDRAGAVRFPDDRANRIRNPCRPCHPCRRPAASPARPSSGPYHHGFGGDHQARDGGGVLQRGAGDLGKEGIQQVRHVRDLVEVGITAHGCDAALLVQEEIAPVAIGLVALHFRAVKVQVFWLAPSSTCDMRSGARVRQKLLFVHQ